MKRHYLYIPLALFLLLAAVLLWQLARNAQGETPGDLESALIGQPVPAFSLNALDEPGKVWDRSVLTDGKPLLLNVWATWCPTCRAEHRFLNRLAAQGVRIVGMNYKDDRQKAVKWLREPGNPYALSLFDGSGMPGRNSIADSNAMIASDMKLKVYELMLQGRNKQEIIDYMVARYGHFVTYDPPVTPATIVLWVLPVLFIFGGAGGVVSRSRRRQKMTDFIADDPVNRDPVGKVSYWVFAPGALILAAVSSGVYLKTSGLQQVKEWQQSVRQMPVLLKRVMDPQAVPLTMEEMARLGLGLRTRLQQEPDNPEGWMMPGRIGMVLNNAATATQAFAHAYKLSPTNDDAKLGYAEVLTRSADPQDNRLGSILLREMLKTNHANIRVLSLLAFNAFEQQNYREAIGAWQIMLKILPANDPRRAVIERSIGQAVAGSAESADKQ